VRINLSIELPRPARRSMALVLGALLLLTPAVVLASHQFPDVPTSHPFHDQISAIAGAGITAGFPDGGYHPGDPVTRQAMAAFMQRGFGRVVMAKGGSPITSGLSVDVDETSAQAVPVRSVVITVPGATNTFTPQQLVHLRGSVVFVSQMSVAPPSGCPCEFYSEIRDVATNAYIGGSRQTFESSTAGTNSYTFDVEALVAAPPGERTYRLFVGLSDRNLVANSASFTISSESSLSAMTFPFGGNTP
jgi:S-layer homology domain